MPRPEGSKENGRQGCEPPHHFYKIAQSLLVVMTISKKIPILPLTRGTQLHPWPRTLLAGGESEIGRIKERTSGIVYHYPSITRDQPRIHRLARPPAPRALQRARGGQPTAAGRHGRAPAHPAFL